MKVAKCCKFTSCRFKNDSERTVWKDSLLSKTNMIMSPCFLVNLGPSKIQIQPWVCYIKRSIDCYWSHLVWSLAKIGVLSICIQINVGENIVSVLPKKPTKAWKNALFKGYIFLVEQSNHLNVILTVWVRLVLFLFLVVQASNC